MGLLANSVPATEEITSLENVIICNNGTANKKIELNMGSGKLMQTRTQLTMAEEKKSLLNPFKNVLKLFKRGKDKGSKDTKLEKNVKTEEIVNIEPLPVTPVPVLLEKLEEKKKEQEESEEENELDNFTHKVIEEEPRVSIESQSSIDSGFVEKGSDNEKENDPSIEKETHDLTEKLKELKVDTEEKEGKTKKKTLQTVVIARRPVKSNNYTSQSKSHPYAIPRQDDHGYRQTQNVGQIQSQINTQTLSGGHVIVNDTKADNIYLAQAVNGVDQSVEQFTRTTKDEQELILSVANEYISKEWNGMDFFDFPATNPLSVSANDDPFAAFSPEMTSMPIQQNFQFNGYDPTLSQLNYVNEDHQSLYKSSIFPTPPRSENVPSPMSDLYYPTSSDYTLSPPTSSPMRNLDLEVCQPLGDYPIVEEELVKIEPKKEETTHNMKYYKDLQKELSSKFSKKECCQKSRRTCKEILLEHIQRLQMKERVNVSLNVAKMQSEHTFAVLRYLIIKLSEGTADEDTQLMVFCLICDKMLEQNSELFVNDFGLELIKLAVLRCYSKPFLTRYLVQCVRVALKTKDHGAGESPYVFTEVDAQGDNLLHACVRKGDECADVLSELVRKDANDLPLFNVHHSNSDGYMPLHLACSTHSATEPRLHLTHVLMEHAGASLWRKDVKGGDTSLHLAVNSPHCDLNLIMVIFQQFERNEWKGLAQAQNRSSVTARDYARSASRSSSRPNYPPEVLEFLKKCR